jgi:hypothetical protein
MANLDEIYSDNMQSDPMHVHQSTPFDLSKSITALN